LESGIREGTIANINRKPYKVILMTRETHQKESKYYYHFLEDIKIEPDSGLAGA